MSDNAFPVGPPIVGVILTLFAVFSVLQGRYNYMLALLGLVVVLTMGHLVIWHR